MAQGVPSPEVRRNRRAEKAAALFAALDAELGEESTVTVDVIKEIQAKKGTPDELAVEAEAVLLYFNLKGEGFSKQECPVCKRQFAHKYWIKGAQLKCSNECRAAALAELGIEWNYLKTIEERWGLKDGHNGRIPLIVPPVALPLVEAAIKRENLEKEQQELSSQEVSA